MIWRKMADNFTFCQLVVAFLCTLFPGVAAFDAGDAIALVLGLIIGILGICACLGYYARKRAAGQVVQVVADGQLYRQGHGMKEVDILQTEGVGYSILIDKNGTIADLGPDDEVKDRHPNLTADFTIDAAGKSIIPGLVDVHTHPVWSGDRVHEFAMKLAGATYMDVHKAGGGIHFTVEKTRQASEEELFTSFRDRLHIMRESGTTLVECKSGYGLDVETEMKMLRVIERAKETMNIGISSTYCGAHAVPKGKTAVEATEHVINQQIPELKRLIDAGSLHVDNVDVFCERGVFDAQQTRRILVEGKKLGLNINFHGDELSATKSAELGAELEAHAVSHLEEISDDGIAAMASAGTVGVVLPTTAYILRLKPPPVRKMIDNGMIVALGSDFNPNAYCMSMPIVMHLACVTLHMSMPEALNAATINASHALGESARNGSIEVGKYGNLVILNTNRWENLVYQLGCHKDIIQHVVYKGDVVHSNMERF